MEHIFNRAAAWATLLIVTGLVSGLAGCGSESGAPAGSTITISPADKKWQHDGVPGGPSDVTSQDFLVTLATAGGTPINNATLSVSLDLAAGSTIPATAAMAIYEDTDNDGIAETGPLTSPFLTKTGPFGSKKFRINMEIGGTAEYKGTLAIYSGPVSGFASLEVDCTDNTATAGVTEC